MPDEHDGPVTFEDRLVEAHYRAVRDATAEHLAATQVEPGPALDVKAAAELLNVSVDVVYRAVRSGQPPAVRVGRELRFSRARLGRFLKQGLLEDD